MNEDPPTDPKYERALASRLSVLLKRGPVNLGSLISKSEGAYPTDVLAVLYKLQRAGNAKELQKDVWTSCESVSLISETKGTDEISPWEDELKFPEPHPLDFDWRFSRHTLEYLEKTAVISNAKTIAVLGAPTLFKYLADRGKDVHLFDRNQQITSYLKKAGYEGVSTCDLFRFHSDSRFDSVVADPPWYLDHYRAFIESARRLLNSGGNLLLSILPRLTRPLAESDRTEILEFTSERGFDLTSAEPGVLRYVSPLFEVEALKSEGLNLSAWRLGDLGTFALRERHVSEFKPEYLEEDQPWRTFEVGRTVVKVKWKGIHSESVSFDCHNVSGGNGARFQSVSRRSPLRSTINVWTSRNVAMQVSRPDLACVALELMEKGHPSEEVIKALKDSKHLGDAEIVQLRGFVAALTSDSND